MWAIRCCFPRLFESIRSRSEAMGLQSALNGDAGVIHRDLTGLCYDAGPDKDKAFIMNIFWHFVSLKKELLKLPLPPQKRGLTIFKGTNKPKWLTIFEEEKTASGLGINLQILALLSIIGNFFLKVRTNLKSNS